MERRIPVRCFYCQREGHKVANCPSIVALERLAQLQIDENVRRRREDMIARRGWYRRRYDSYRPSYDDREEPSHSSVKSENMQDVKMMECDDEIIS